MHKSLPVLLALHCAPSLAEVHGFVLPRIAYYEQRVTPVDPGDVLQLPERTAALAAGLRGETRGITWRLRGELQAMATGGRTASRTDWALQELARSFTPADRLSLVIGKRVLAWDVSFSSSPLGFFQRDPDLADPTDRLERAEGLPLVALSYRGSGFDLTAVYSDDRWHDEDGFNRGLRQVAGNLTVERGRGAYSFVLQRAADESPGIGFAAVFSANDALTLQASASTRRGARRPISRRVLERELAFDVADPNSAWRLHSRSRFTHAVLGMHWTISPGTSLLLEWCHEGAGLSRTEWEFWEKLVAFHAGPATAAPPGPSSASAHNLAFDAAALLPRGARRDYLFARAATTWRTMGVAAFARSGIADGSTVLNLSASREYGASIVGELSLSFQTTPSGSELSYVPIGSSAQAWLKYAF